MGFKVGAAYGWMLEASKGSCNHVLLCDNVPGNGSHERLMAVQTLGYIIGRDLYTDHINGVRLMKTSA